MTDPKPDLTVCVTGFGPPEFSRRFLRSVYDTAEPVAVECFLICPMERHDFSSLTEEFPGLHILTQLSASMVNTSINRALAESTGRYVSIWNDASLVGEGCLRGLVDFLDGVPDAGVVGPKIRNEKGEIQQVARSFPTFFSLLADSGLQPGRPAPGWSEYAGGEADWFAGPGITFSRLLVDDIGLIQPHLLLYWPIDFCRRAKKAGWHVHYLHNAQAAGSIYSWRRSLTCGREIFWRHLWEACLLKGFGLFG